MRLYLDDDSAWPLLARLLRKASHDVQLPGDVGLLGEDDPLHFTYTIEESRLLLTGNHRDFELLHNLVLKAGGHHPGILVVCRDNDPTRDLSARGIVQAIRRLEAAQIEMADGFFILNHWR